MVDSIWFNLEQLLVCDTELSIIYNINLSIYQLEINRIMQSERGITNVRGTSTFMHYPWTICSKGLKCNPLTSLHIDILYLFGTTEWGTSDVSQKKNTAMDKLKFIMEWKNWQKFFSEKFYSNDIFKEPKSLRLFIPS